MAAFGGLLARLGIWVANVIGIGLIWKWMFPSSDEQNAMYVLIGVLAIVCIVLLVLWLRAR